MKQAVFSLAMLGFFFSGISFSDASYRSDKLHEMLKAEIRKSYDKSKPEIVGEISWVKGSEPQQVRSVRILNQDGRGNLQFIAYGTSVERSAMSSEGRVSFMAWTPAWIARKRIYPGTKVEADLFTRKEIDIASGIGYEFRGVILNPDENLSGLESLQTILEGQFLTTSALKKTPDIHRGDSVKIQLISDDLVVSTLGTAVESAYFDNAVKVITNKGKKEFLGKLQPGNVVEVYL